MKPKKLLFMLVMCVIIMMLVNHHDTFAETESFPVDTIVGGIGAGIEDGPVHKAKVSWIVSMDTDESGNVYFLDSYGEGASKEYFIRMYDPSNKTVKTIQTINEDFDNLSRNINYEYLLPKKVIYHNQKLYLFALHTSKRYLLYEIFPKFQLVYNYLDSYSMPNIYAFKFIGDEKILYQSFDGHESRVYTSQLNSDEVEIFADSIEQTGILSGYTEIKEVVYRDHELFYIRDNSLYHLNYFPRKLTNISNISIEPKKVREYNNKFYFYNGMNVYILDLEGNIAPLFEEKDLVYNDGNTMETISNFVLDADGNIIVYDHDNKALRKITLDDPSKPTQENIPITNISISRKTLGLNIGDSEKLSATIEPSNATNQNVVWKSSNENVAIVDQQGQVTAINTGVTTIFVTTEDGNHVAASTVTVTSKKEDVVEISGISIEPSTLTMKTGEKYPVNVVIEPSNATKPNIEWSSSDEKIITVDSNNNVVAHKAGVATVIAKTGKHFAFLTVIVTESNNDSPNEEEQNEMWLELDESDFQLEPGENLRFDVFAVYKDGTEKVVTDEASYRSTSASNVVVNKGMIFIPQTADLGEYTVKITYNGETLEVPVKVATVQLVELIPSVSLLNLKVGQKADIIVNGKYSNDKIEEVTTKMYWITDDSQVANVNTGQVIANSPGTAYITASLDGKEIEIPVFVTEVSVIDSLEASERNLTIILGDQIEPDIWATYKDGSKERVLTDITWQTRDKTIVRLDNAGVVTAESVGTTRITANYKGKSIAFDVEVLAEKPVSKLKINRNKITIGLDQKWPINVIATYSDGTKADVTSNAVWTDKIATIASVDNNGLIEANGVGQTTITAEYRGKAVSVDVEVVENLKKQRPTNAKNLEKQNAIPQKSWTVRFNTLIDNESISNESVYITDENDRVIPVYLTMDGKELTVTPVKAFNIGQTYYLNITTDVKSVSDKSLSNAVTLPFNIN